MAKKIRVGIVGLGAIGPVHADAYQASGEAEIVALCDLDQGKLKSHGDRLNVAQRFTDYRELIAADLDAVSVCVPNDLHRDVAVAALRAGRNVLCEKPTALNAKQAQQMADAAKKSKGILQIGMVNRQRADSQVLRQYIQAGELGDIYHMRAVIVRRRGIPGLGGWFTTKARSGGGPMIDLGVHLFDLAMYLADQWKPTAVSAATYDKFGPRMKNYRFVSMWAGPPKLDGKFDVEDYSTGFVRFPKKVTMSFEIVWAANAPDACFVELLGDKGGARAMVDGPLTIMTEHNGRIADLTPKFDDRASAFHVQAKKFLAACRGEAAPAATGEQGVTVMKLIDAIYASDRQGKEVKIHA